MTVFRSRSPRPVTAELRARNQFDGQITRVTFESEDGDFKVVTFRTEDGYELKAKGNLYGAGTGQPMRIAGTWRDDPRYGWTFQVESYQAVEPASEEGILAYLGSGLIKGLGPAKARKIVDHFGERTLEILDSAPEMLREIGGFGRKTVKQIAEQWEAHRATREAMLALKEMGLTNALSLRLLRHYGPQAATILRTNPYRAGLEVSHIGFTTADRIAEKLGIARDSPDRIRAAFVHLLDQASGEGHTFLHRDQLIERTTDMLGLELTAVEAVMEGAVADKLIMRDTVGDRDDCLFIPALHKCETGVARFIATLARGAKPLLRESVDARIADFEKRFRFQLAPQQQDAIRAAARGGICVITGGPGTGKTTLVRALLHILRGTSLRYALCSPTGRAAQRMSETTGQEASTIHRLLKWNTQTGRFQFNDENPLPVDLVIVDEASMLDIPLAYSLLRAVPDGATVVFVGDVDQLPSVGPGTFLADLIRSARVGVTKLEVIFRQAEKSLIILNSHRINEGRSLKLADKGDTAADFYFIHRTEPPEINDTLLTMVTERIPRRLGGDPIDNVQVLSPVRRGPLGTAELNERLQRQLNPNGVPLPGIGRFRIGDKVIQTSNNYDLDVYNGDVGRIQGIQTETRQVRVLFGKRMVLYPAENLDELELAYAITIHKSQGSEYPAVVILLHTSHFIMLKRNLVYTAVTRGKKLVVVVGHQRALYRAIRTSPDRERLTALEYWLSRAPESGEFL